MTKTSLLVAFVCVLSGCAEVHRPRAGHFVAHGFYQAGGRYRVRAVTEAPRTSLLPDGWELRGFGPAEDGVPGLEELGPDDVEDPTPRYDFRYEHAQLGSIWAKTVRDPAGTAFPGSAPSWPELAGVPLRADAYRGITYGPATVDGEHAWIATFDVRKDGEEARITIATVRAGYRPRAFQPARLPPLVVFGYLSSIERHAEGLAAFESMLRRVDFRVRQR
jgi:hypothetical protein